jgi:hypothetical protein
LEPKKPYEYLSMTEFSVKHLYDGVNACFNYYKEASEYWDISKLNEPLNEENKNKLDKYLSLARKYFDLNFSENTFCGSILQVASIGIDYFSRNNNIPDSFEDVIRQNSEKVKRFCIGKELYGIPIGLIIYAGRNQYSHWNERDPYEINKKVFEKLTLAFSKNMFSDLAFDLLNPGITIYSKEILLIALKWYNYDIYYKEMKELFDNYC